MCLRFLLVSVAASAAAAAAPMMSSLIAVTARGVVHAAVLRGDGGAGQLGRGHGHRSLPPGVLPRTGLAVS